MARRLSSVAPGLQHAAHQLDFPAFPPFFGGNAGQICPTRATRRRRSRNQPLTQRGHHAQIRAIKAALAREQTWHSEPFVDTVDKMHGQECQAVIVSYGVSDRETALAEADFIYSLNRLNVAVTRAKAKCIVFLSQPLLEPSFELLSNEAAARGLGHMHALISFCREHGESRTLELAGPRGRRPTCFRFPPASARRDSPGRHVN
jgi:hypothetical protein